MEKHLTTFINNSPLPINIETWQSILFGYMSEMISQTVKPGEKIMMVSDTGEWIINTNFYNKPTCDEWIAIGHEKNLGKEIGKFRNKPCAQGNYNWMYNNDFQIIYNNTEGIATFSKV